MVLDYSILAPSEDLLGTGAYSAGLGLNLLGGSLEGRLASAGPPRDGAVRADASWTGVWRRSRYVTQLRLGDGLSTGPRPRSVRGVLSADVLARFKSDMAPPAEELERTFSLAQAHVEVEH